MNWLLAVTILITGCALVPRMSPQTVAVVRDVAIEVAARFLEQAAQQPLEPVPPPSPHRHEIRTVRLDPPHIPPRPFF